MTEKKTCSKKIIIGMLALVVLITACVFVYISFKPATSEGDKTVILKVIDDKKNSTEYEVHTDAEYLQQVMEEAEGLTFDGEETEFGFSVYTVNNVTADFNASGAYWSFYVNDEYCNYGITEQPVNDGDEFTIQYEVYE
ncbi:MAG: DUF4430 domain-containing protein [Schaedlerella sp.]|nr:DUF4430 domain-containing protein [Schaedlerella sp.]